MKRIIVISKADSSVLREKYFLEKRLKEVGAIAI